MYLVDTNIWLEFQLNLARQTPAQVLAALPPPPAPAIS